MLRSDVLILPLVSYSQVCLESHRPLSYKIGMRFHLAYINWIFSGSTLSLIGWE